MSSISPNKMVAKDSGKAARDSGKTETCAETAPETSFISTLQSAVDHFKNKEQPKGKQQPPDPAAMAQALLAAEKSARQTAERPTAERLAGSWRLGFITGTKKSRERAGVVLGAGRFLPRWVQIQITYTFNSDNGSNNGPNNEGTVLNAVRCGPLNLTVSGPIRFFPQRRILAFDFPQMAIRLGGIQLFEGYIPKGTGREKDFLADNSPRSLRNQAFFTYFWVTPDSIAARGRGGGLALWYREASSPEN